jgi:hypothetical protein
MSTQLREILYTESQDMLILSSTVASRYYKCCIEGSTSPGNYRSPSYVYFPNIPATEDNLYFFILFCLFTTCFGPYGPSSGETQQHLYIYENYHTTAYPLFLQLFT